MINKLKIGLILNDIPGYSETFIINKINGLINRNFHVSLFISKKYKINPFSNRASIYCQVNIKNKLELFFVCIRLLLHPIISFRFLFLEIKSNKSFISSIKNLIINAHILFQKPDWIHFSYATLAIRRENVPFAIKAKSSVSFRGYDINLYPFKDKDCYKLLWDRIDQVHSISDDLYKKALYLGLSKKVPFKKICPGIDTNYFRSSVKFSINKPIRFLSVGRLDWIKGYEYAIKAIYHLIEKKYNIEYHIVGEGDYKESIMFAIKQFNLEKNIILKGSLSSEKVREAMEWADIYIQPSIEEGFCNSVLEAQSIGLPCIVSNAGGLKENIIHGKTGWIFKRRSVEDIIEKILYVINMDEKNLIQIINNALLRVNKEFSLSQNIDRWENFFTLK